MQEELSDFDRRQEHFSRNRAFISRIVHAEPGLTYEQIGKRFLIRHGFLPTIGNRIREMRMLGWITTTKEDDGRLHVYPKENKD